MNARIKRRPADEVLREIADAEKIEQRKADKEPRKRVSDQEAAWSAIAHVWDCSAEEIETLRALTDQMKGHAPDEWVKVSETQAGVALGSRDGVTEASQARRFKRRYLEGIERDLQGRIKKRIGERQPGKLVFKGKDEAIPKCAEYRSEVPQMICDVIRLANLARGKKLRRQCFLDAVRVVHAELPDYKPSLVVVDAPEKIKKGAPQKERAGGVTRATTRLVRDVAQLVDLEKEKGAPALLTTYNRTQARVAAAFMPAVIEADPEAAHNFAHNQFIEAARAQIEIARAQGSDALEELQARLFADLGELFADPEAPEDEAELVATNYSENLQKPQQNRMFDSQALDTGVQSSTPLHAVLKPDLVYESEGFDP